MESAGSAAPICSWWASSTLLFFCYFCKES